MSRLKIVFEPYPNTKNIPLRPQKNQNLPQNKVKISKYQVKSKVGIEGTTWLKELHE